MPAYGGIINTNNVPVNSLVFNMNFASAGRPILCLSWFNNAGPPLVSLGGIIPTASTFFLDGFGVVVGSCLVDVGPVLAGITPITISFPAGLGNLIASAWMPSPSAGVHNKVINGAMPFGFPIVSYGGSPIPLPVTNIGVISSSGGGPVVTVAPPFGLLYSGFEVIGGINYYGAGGWNAQLISGMPVLSFGIPGLIGGCATLASTT